MKGFQIFFDAIKGQLQSQLDVIVSVVHFMLFNDDFLCVGIGEEFTPADATGGSEMLPTGWNRDQTVYTLKYRSRDTDNLQVLFKGIVAGDLFIVSALPLKSSNDVHSASIKASQFVSTTWNGTYEQAFVGGEVKPLADLLRKELFDKLRPSPPPTANAGATGQQQQQPNANEPGANMREQVWVPPPQPNYGPYAQPQPYGEPLAPPPLPRIGGADLDPFNRGMGGGMLYDPFTPQGGFRPQFNDPFHPLPPGGRPPGARYDIIGPGGPRPKGPGKDNRNQPNPDHFPPPDGYDPFL